ncbi:MAG: hypothetical protein Q9181_002630 [Wetmoreana brouardii]
MPSSTSARPVPILEKAISTGSRRLPPVSGSANSLNPVHYDRSRSTNHERYVNDVANILKQQTTTYERGKFLQDLLGTLPRKCVREIVGEAGKADFRFDIISHLPIELLCSVFQHLDIYQAFQLRRVSRRWLQSLSAPKLVESLLRPWFAIGDVDLRIPPDLSYEAALALKAEHVDAFTTGNPYSVVQGDLELAIAAGCTGFDRSLVAYSHRRLAWVDGLNGRVHVRNLEFDQETLYTPPNREKATKIDLSTDIVAMTTTSGKCYAWDCATSAPASVRLPSAAHGGLFVSGSSLAIVHRTEAQGQVGVTTWSLHSCQTRSFHIPLRGKLRSQSRKPSYRVYMTADSVLFVERKRGPPDEVFFTRCTLDGKVLAQGTSGLLHRTFRTGYVDIMAYSQHSRTKTKSLESLDRILVRDEQDDSLQALRKTVAKGTRGIIRLIYDLRHDKFLNQEECAIPCKNIELHHTENYWYIWKSMAFRFAQDGWNDPGSIALNLQSRDVTNHYMQRFSAFTCRSENEGWLSQRGRPGSPDTSFVGRAPAWFWGDEIFMVRVFPNGFTAFCFDKHITMPDEDLNFRQQREQARLERIRRRDHQYEAAQPTPRQDISELEAQLAQHEQRLWAQEKAAATRQQDDEVGDL